MNLVQSLTANKRQGIPEDSYSRANRMISEMDSRFISATELTKALRDLEYEIHRVCIINNVYDICRVLQEIRIRCSFPFNDEYFIEYVTHIFGCASFTYRRDSYECDLERLEGIRKPSEIDKLKTGICYDCWAKFLHERNVVEDFCMYHVYRNKLKKEYSFMSKVKRFFRLK